MLHPLLLQKLKCLRFKADKTVIINSGFRCPDYNRKVNGVKVSYHLLGMAVDIHVPGMSLKDLLLIAKEIGFKGIGFYPKRNFLHLDIRPTGQARWQS